MKNANIHDTHQLLTFENSSTQPKDQQMCLEKESEMKLDQGNLYDKVVNDGYEVKFKSTYSLISPIEMNKFAFSTSLCKYQ